MAMKPPQPLRGGTAWIILSIWRYPYVLNQDWPETNPNPQGTAAVFATFEAAAAVFAITAASVGIYGLYSERRARQPIASKPGAEEALGKPTSIQ